MTKYICTECGCRFDEDEIGIHQEWIGEDRFSSNSSGWYSTCCCPRCGSEDYEEAEECDLCGETYSRDDDMILCGGDWYCKKCAEEVVEEFLSKWGMTEGAQAGLDLYEARMAKMKKPVLAH